MMRLAWNADLNSQKEKTSVPSLAHTTQNPPMILCIPDHSDNKARRGEDACNMQFESFPIGRSIWRSSWINQNRIIGNRKKAAI